MTRQENPNFVASKYAPNYKEVTYWVDLSADATGNVIKSYNGSKWITINYSENSDQSERINTIAGKVDTLEQSLATEINRATGKESELQTSIGTKAEQSEITRLEGVITALTDRVEALENAAI